MCFRVTSLMKITRLDMALGNPLGPNLFLFSSLWSACALNPEPSPKRAEAFGMDFGVIEGLAGCPISKACFVLGYIQVKPERSEFTARAPASSPSQIRGVALGLNPKP